MADCSAADDDDYDGDDDDGDDDADDDNCPNCEIWKPRAAGIFRNVYCVITITLSNSQYTRTRYKTTNKLPLLRAV